MEQQPIQAVRMTALDFAVRTAGPGSHYAPDILDAARIYEGYLNCTDQARTTPSLDEDPR